MAKLQVDFEVFLVLLKATSKQQVLDICENAFKYREKETQPGNVMKSVAEVILSDTAEASRLLLMLGKLIKIVLFEGFSTQETITALFPTDFHKNLKDLLTKIIAEKFSVWKCSTLTDFASMPRLAEFDWRVDLKMASNKTPRINEPTCILHFKIQDPTHLENQEERFQSLNVELSKEKLDTMLHGLGRIRDQLSAVAKK